MSHGPTVITIGNFDGVHAGHAALVHRARRIADANGATVTAMVFDPHPLTVLRPEATPARLMTFERRSRLLQHLGVEHVVRLEPTPELLDLTPDEFIVRHLVARSVVAVVEGEDFRFGKGRAGSIATLREAGRRDGFNVAVVDPIDVDLEDQSVVRASSTLVRWLIAHGRMRDASRVLGRPHELTGHVIRGDRRGRDIGYPTANLHTACLMPRDGVYAGLAHVSRSDSSKQRQFVAAVSVGTKPTFGGTQRVTESFLLDVPTAGGPAIEGLPEYGWAMRLEFIGWVRDQLRFDGVEPLVEQMDRDCVRVRQIADDWRKGVRPRSQLAECS